MYGVKKVRLWSDCGTIYIRYMSKSENGHIVGIDGVMMPPTEHIECWHQLSVLNYIYLFIYLFIYCVPE